MAQKRIKSFSPYHYNVRYRKPGTSPYNQPKGYLPNAGYNYPEYVVSKKKEDEEIIKQKPNYEIPVFSYYVYSQNQFYYLINNDCEIEFIKLNSTFSLLQNKNEIEDSETSTIFNLKYSYRIFDILIDDINDDHIIKIEHNLNSIIDLVILDNNTR